jgi:hypothetical protein
MAGPSRFSAGSAYGDGYSAPARTTTDPPGTGVPHVSTATKIYSDLQSLARMRGRATSEILTIYGLERFVDRLTRTEFRDDFVLKGGILLGAWVRNTRVGVLRG